MGLDYFASAPTMVLPPAQVRQQHHLRHDSLTGMHEQSMIDSTPIIPPTSTLSPVTRLSFDASTKHRLTTHPAQQRPVTSRKRSRADVGDDCYGDNAEESVAAPVKPAAEPIYGPGMALIYPDEPKLNLSAGSQTGTWVEQREIVNAKADAMVRPKLSARKSQRRSQETTATLSSVMADFPIDPIVLHLGIGWKRVSESSPATAGQQAFIRNQFGFGDPAILLQHEGMGIYVVRSKPASAAGYWDQWWLFTEDLKSCQFLCHDENDLFRRLSNKKQDERGNWRPDILVEGPVIRAKDCPLSTNPGFMMMTDGMEGVTAVKTTCASNLARENHVDWYDVEMSLC